MEDLHVTSLKTECKYFTLRIPRLNTMEALFIYIIVINQTGKQATKGT